MKKVLITGAAGFIGYHLSERLLAEGFQVTGLDNLNGYYSPRLKNDRLERLKNSPAFQFAQLDVADGPGIMRLFASGRFEVVIHLAAQAGVRHSIAHSEDYVTSNLQGFHHILEACRAFPVQHLLAASTSSVYGLNARIPSRETDNTDAPANFYAASKKANELMAYSYGAMFNIPVSMLRFFTVYGPWGRPDMALFIFADAIRKNKPVPVFNQGNMKRDWTYVSDVVESIFRLIPVLPEPFEIYNVGKGEPVELMDFIAYIATGMKKTYTPDYLPMQPGDLPLNFADCTKLQAATGYKPETTVQEGVSQFLNWYATYKNPDLI